MKLVVVVPDGIQIERRKGLSGPESEGQERNGGYVTKPMNAHGYWYGPSSQADGWTAVSAGPDPERTATGG